MFMDASSAPTASPNAPATATELPHLVTGPDPEQRQQHDRLRPPQYDWAAPASTSFSVTDAADAGEDRHGGEEGGQQSVGYPVPVLNRRYSRHQQREGDPCTKKLSARRTRPRRSTSVMAGQRRPQILLGG
jgi:hypothetical protein